MSVKVTRADQDNSLILSFSGQLTLGEGTGNLKDAVREICDDELKGKYLVLDLAEVTKIDSAAKGDIIVLHTTTEQRGSALYLCGLQPHPRKTFSITKLDRTLRILPNREQAIATLKADPLKLQPVPVG